MFFVCGFSARRAAKPHTKMSASNMLPQAKRRRLNRRTTQLRNTYE
jgi:hypothetical protein